MGMFDSLYVQCPTCDSSVEFQSKEDECYMNVWRTFDETPTAVLYDVMNEPHYCAGCGNWMALIDPAHPPGPRPRPDLRAATVKTPEDASIHRTQPFLRWWPDNRPFTYDDLLEPPAPRVKPNV